MKAATARAKGRQAESGARDFLRANGFPTCERIPAGAEEDRGDLSGVPGFTVQVKHYADPARAVREGIAGAIAQQGRAGTRWAAAIVRPPGKPNPAEWRVVMTLDQWADLVAEVNR